MFREWLSQFYYRGRDELATMQQLRITNDTPYGDFVNAVIYDALLKSQCIQSPRDNATTGSGDTRARYEWLCDVYAENSDRLAISKEWQAFADGTTFDEFENLLVYDLFLRMDCIYRTLAKSSVVTVTRCLKDEQINVVAMTEGIPMNDECFHQTITCKDPLKYPVGELYFLVPKVTTKSDFQRSIRGLNYQITINSNYGQEVQSFPNVYVAQAVMDYSVLNKDEPQWSLPLLKELCQELFPLWEPELGPLKHMIEHGSSIVAFRVYKTTTEVRKYIRSYRKRVPKVCGEGTEVIIQQPMISDAEFRRQQLALLKTFMHH